MNDSLSLNQRVRAVVSSAALRRRVIEGSRWRARVAPVTAAVVAAAAVACRLAGWPPVVSLGLLVAAALAGGVHVWLSRRPIEPSDAVAARVDEDAGLGGELRSAHWFASAAERDAWTDFHLQRAAARADGVDWAAVYPPIRARRAWTVTAVLAAIALAVPVAVPSLGFSLWPSAVSATSDAPVSLDTLPADLRQAILDAVTAIAKGEIAPEMALATLTESRAFAALDAETQHRVAELLQKAAIDGASKIFANSGGEPVSAEAAKWAKDNLDMLATGKDDPPRPEDGNPGVGKQDEAEQRNEYTEDSASGGEGEASDFQASTRVRTQPQGNPESNQPMPMNGSPDASGEAGTGFGGKHGDVRYGSTKAGDLAVAFRQEIVQADTNTNGDTVESEKRRKTESSRSALSYTRVAGQATFDRARVEAPRAAPEARRPLIERYFVRERENR